MVDVRVPAIIRINKRPGIHALRRIHHETYLHSCSHCNSSTMMPTFLAIPWSTPFLSYAHQHALSVGFSRMYTRNSAMFVSIVGFQGYSCMMKDKGDGGAQSQPQRPCFFVCLLFFSIIRKCICDVFFRGRFNFDIFDINK